MIALRSNGTFLAPDNAQGDLPGDRSAMLGFERRASAGWVLKRAAASFAGLAFVRPYRSQRHLCVGRGAVGQNVMGNDPSANIHSTWRSRKYPAVIISS